MPADHRDSHSLPKHGAEIPVLTTHKSFPDQLLFWARWRLLQLASLPSSPQPPHIEPSKHASLLRQLRNPKCRLPLHRTDVPFPGSSKKLLFLHTFNVIQQQHGIYTHTCTMRDILQHPSSPCIPLPQVVPPAFPSDALSPAPLSP